MRVSSEHKAELVFNIPEGVRVESRYVDGFQGERPVGFTLNVWSTSEESAADAVTKIIQVSDALVAALKEAK